MVAKAEIAAASTESAAGAVPPPGAPREVAQPLGEDLIADQLARASANERELKPLVFAQQPQRPSVDGPAASHPAVSANPKNGTFSKTKREMVDRPKRRSGQ